MRQCRMLRSLGIIKSSTLPKPSAQARKHSKGQTYVPPPNKRTACAPRLGGAAQVPHVVLLQEEARLGRVDAADGVNEHL
jgi:hypothetical protein